MDIWVKNLKWTTSGYILNILHTFNKTKTNTMDNKEIISRLGKEKYVEKLIKNYIVHTSDEYYSRRDFEKDFAQDIYIQLYFLAENLLNHLYKSGEIEYFIRKIIKNNLYSKSSKFWQKYMKNSDKLTNYEYI